MSNTILITGAAGYLGGLLHAALKASPCAVRLTDVKPLPYPMDAGETFTQADLASMEGLKSILQGVDTVFHLGACSVESRWEEILATNITGTYTLFEAARLAGIKRIVYASSHHVVGFYRRNRTVGVEDPPRPDSRYAVSKVFGEALGRLYADKYGLEVICLRLGIVRPKPPNVRALSAWLSEADFARLCLAALRAPRVHFQVMYGVSANKTTFWTNEGAANIDFVPRDQADSFLTADERQSLADDFAAVERKFQGGWFCGMEFNGDPSKIV